MTRQEYYREHSEDFGKKAAILQKRENKLSMARLISFITGLAAFFVLISITVTGAVIALLISLIIFGWLVSWYAQTEKEKDFCKYLETINHLEMQCLQGNFSAYPDGAEYMDREHPNSYDLDLFGHASVFQYVNRTTSKPAADLLAAWLKAPADIKEIILRQQAVLELSPQIDWRQNLITLGYSNKSSRKDPQELLFWFNEKIYFTQRNRLRYLTFALSALALASVILVIFGLPAALLVPVLSVNFLFYFSQGKKINRLHNQVGRTPEMLSAYASTIGLIENQKFTCDKLISLQKIFTGDIPVSMRIKRLSKLVSRLDTRLNIMVAVPLNLFFFWDIHCCLALEKWKILHAGQILTWFSAMSEFEVLSGFANMAFNNTDWAMPGIVPEYFTLKAENVGHPLIPAQRRITNNLEITGSGKTVLVTGSNMSGKSTFLRTCGVNAVLALAGAPVCATSFTITHVQVHSSMRISDSLEDNTSSFYAELKRLAAIIREAEHNQHVFLLLDEILRGTNSNDRYIGSVALIRQLTGYGAVSIVATHDLKLAGLAGELNGHMDNYHFDVKIDGEELFFDYKLTPGICTSMNASLLMKKMGIRI